MRRREFLTLIGCAASTWPVLGHAQQQITPLVGVLCTGTAEALECYLASFREGMHELGYVEGSNIHFEFCLHTIRLKDLMVPFWGFEDGLTGCRGSKPERPSSGEGGLFLTG